MTDTIPLGQLVVRLKQPVKNMPVGTELGYRDVADAIAALGSYHYFDVVRDQQGNPIPPLTPEEIEEAQRAAQRRAKSRRLILGADFDPLWDRVDGIPSATELEQMRQDVEAVADVPPRVEAVETRVARVDPGAAGPVGASIRQGPDGPRFARDAVSADWFSNINDAITAAVASGRGGRVLLSKNTTYTAPEDGIALVPGVTIEGEDTKTSVIAATTSTGFRVKTPLSVCNWVTLRGFSLRNTGSTPIGIDARGLTRCRLERLEIVDFPTGVIFGGDTASYAAGWSNTLRESEIVSAMTSIRMEGMSGSSASANNIRIIENIINMADHPDAIGIDGVAGATNYIMLNDIGYGDRGVGIRLRANADFWTVFGNRFEDIAQNTGANHPVEIEAGSEYHLFVGNTYHLGSLQPWVNDLGRYNTILDNRYRDAEFTESHFRVNTHEVHTRPVYFRQAAGDVALSTRATGDASDRIHLGMRGDLRWYNPTSGALVNQMQVVSTSTGMVSFMDGGLVALPKVASLPSATSSRRGAMFRVEGAAGVADGIYVCVKQADDNYAWKQVTLA